MSAVDDLRERATSKRKAGLHWEASRLETVIERIERCPFPVPQTIIMLTGHHEEALALVESERRFGGSSFEYAKINLANIEAALTELGCL